VEERRERTDDHLRAVHGQGVDENDGVAERLGGRSARGGHALLVHVLAVCLRTRVAGVRTDDVHHELVKGVEHGGVVLA